MASLRLFRKPGMAYLKGADVGRGTPPMGGQRRDELWLIDGLRRPQSAGDSLLHSLSQPRCEMEANPEKPGVFATRTGGMTSATFRAADWICFIMAKTPMK